MIPCLYAEAEIVIYNKRDREAVRHYLLQCNGKAEWQL